MDKLVLVWELEASSLGDSLMEELGNENCKLEKEKIIDLAREFLNVIPLMQKMNPPLYFYCFSPFSLFLEAKKKKEGAEEEKEGKMEVIHLFDWGLEIFSEIKNGEKKFYFAPEFTEKKLLSLESEIYSVGIFLWKSFDVFVEFNSKKELANKDVLCKSFNAEKIKDRPDLTCLSFSQPLIKLLQKCWNVERKERYSNSSKISDDLLNVSISFYISSSEEATNFWRESFGNNFTISFEDFVQMWSKFYNKKPSPSEQKSLQKLLPTSFDIKYFGDLISRIGPFGSSFLTLAKNLVKETYFYFLLFSLISSYFLLFSLISSYFLLFSFIFSYLIESKKMMKIEDLFPNWTPKWQKNTSKINLMERLF